MGCPNKNTILCLFVTPELSSIFVIIDNKRLTPPSTGGEKTVQGMTKNNNAPLDRFNIGQDWASVVTGFVLIFFRGDYRLCCCHPVIRRKGRMEL